MTIFDQARCAAAELINYLTQMRIRRISPFVVLGASLAWADEYQSTVAPFLAKHCVMCHSTKAKAANLDLERFKDAAAALAERDVWEGVALRCPAG